MDSGKTSRFPMRNRALAFVHETDRKVSTAYDQTGRTATLVTGRQEDGELSRQYFTDRRHCDTNYEDNDDNILEDWRMKERMKTVSVALLLCLNIGVDPPDVVKS